MEEKVEGKVEGKVDSKGFVEIVWKMLAKDYDNLGVRDQKGFCKRRLLDGSFSSRERGRKLEKAVILRVGRLFRVPALQPQYYPLTTMNFKSHYQYPSLINLLRYTKKQLPTGRYRCLLLEKSE